MFISVFWIQIQLILDLENCPNLYPALDPSLYTHLHDQFRTKKLIFFNNSFFETSFLNYQYTKIMSKKEIS